MYSNNQGLPHRTDVLESQPTQFPPHSPPVLFNVLIHPDVANFLPPLAAALANEIAARSQNNAIRVFQFNMASANQFNNPYFASLLGMAAGVLSVRHIRGAIRDINSGIAEAVFSTVSARVSLLITEFPMLTQFVDQGIVQEAMNNQGMAAGLINEVQQFQNQMTNANQQQPYGGGGMQSPGNGRFSPQNQVVSNQRHMQQVDRAMSVGASPFMPISSSPALNNSSVAGGREYRVSPSPAPMVAQPQAVPIMNVPVLGTVQTAVAQMVNPSQPTDEDKSPLKWKPSRTQTYLPGFNHFIQKRQLSEISEGDVKIVVANIVSKREDEMNREDHQLTSLKKAVVSNELLMPYKDVTSERAFEVPPPKQEAFTIEDGDDMAVRDVLARWVYAPSAEMANFIGRSLAILQGSLPAHLVCGSVGNAMTLTADLGNTPAMELADVQTFDEIRSVQRKMRKLYSEASIKNDGSVEDEERLDLCRSLARYSLRMDKVFTDEFNSMMNNMMGMKGWKIESFLSESEAVLGIIAKNMSSHYHDTLMANQALFAARCITTLIEPPIDQLVFATPVISTEEDEVLHPMMIPENVGFLYLGVMSDQLGLDLNTDQPIGILQSALPSLYNMIWASFRSLQLTKRVFKHLYVVTADDVILEAHQSLLSKDVYALTPVKSI